MIPANGSLKADLHSIIAVFFNLKEVVSGAGMLSGTGSETEAAAPKAELFSSPSAENWVFAGTSAESFCPQPVDRISRDRIAVRISLFLNLRTFLESMGYMLLLQRCNESGMIIIT